MKPAMTLFRIILPLLLLYGAVAGCTAPQRTGAATSSPQMDDGSGNVVAIADLVPVDLDAPLRVVATTSIIGDVARTIGGDQIDLQVLLPAGSDPHTWVPTPQDLVLLSNADLLLINGVGLEEGLAPVLASISGPQIVSVNENVPIYSGLEADTEEEHADEEHTDEEHADEEHADEPHEHAHEAGDPHTWQDVANVRIWAQNIADLLSALDPPHADDYTTRADAYRSELSALDDQIAGLMATVPPDARKLVTDHDDLGYFARAYGFDVVGTVIPSFSALASVSAQSMAALQEQIEEESVRAIFVGNTVNRDLANQIASDTGVQVVPLYTDALGAPDSAAPTYVEMMRYNANTIAEALHTGE